MTKEKKPTKLKQKAKKESTPKRTGRPEVYSEELAAKVIHYVATTKLSLRDICAKDDTPSSNVVFEWLYKYPEFNEQYLVAKKQQQQIIMDDIQEVFKEVERFTYRDKDGNERIDPPIVSLIAKKVEHLRWCAARLAPRVWSDKNQIDEMQDKQEDMMSELKELRKNLDEKNKKEY